MSYCAKRTLCNLDFKPLYKKTDHYFSGRFLILIFIYMFYFKWHLCSIYATNHTNRSLLLLLYVKLVLSTQRTVPSVTEILNSKKRPVKKQIASTKLEYINFNRPRSATNLYAIPNIAYIKYFVKYKRKLKKIKPPFRTAFNF